MADSLDSAPRGRDGSVGQVAIDRVLELIGARATVDQHDGYVDALGEGRVRRSAVQRLMQSTLLPVIYERLWRPVIFGAATIGLSEADEAGRMRSLMALQPGDVVLDLACGPGNTTRRLVGQLGADGLIVGVDAAPAMLARAVADTDTPEVAYVRADGAALPFPDGCFDAVACFGALYLVDDPFAVIDEMVRVLAPGGRVAILTTCHRAPGVLQRPAAELLALGSAIRWFGVDEITGALKDRGLVGVHRELHGLMQTVGAVRP